MKYLLRNDVLLVQQGGTRYIVTDASPLAGRIRLFDELTNREEFVLEKDVRKAIASGEWLHERPGHQAPLVSPQVQNDPKLDTETEYALHIVREVRRVAKMASISTRAAIERVRGTREKGRAPCRFPSNATIYRLLTRERNNVPLYSGNKNKGNRNPKRTKEVRRMVVDMASKHFQDVQSRWTLHDLVDYINTVAVVEGIIPPKDRISREYVRDVIVAELGPDLEIDRMDPRTANSFKAIAKAPIVTSYLLERVEQDALHLPWRVVTPDGVSHHVYWLHAIDCYSGMPVGWKMVVGSPGVTDSLQCIESILYSKAEYFESIGLTTGKDCHGTPQMLVLDNGGENKGERIKKLAHLGMEVMHCKANTPQEKPYIERLNRSLKQALQPLHGCTRFDDVDGMRDPEELNDLPMTMEALEKWIVRWYMEDWANKVLKRLLMTVFTEPSARGNTPWKRWHHSAELRGQSVALPPPFQEWQRTMYHYERRILSRKTGITYRTFCFKGDSLTRLISIYGENYVDVLVDPDDFRRVFVLGPNEELIPLVNMYADEATLGYSFDQALQVLNEAEEEDAIGEAERLKFRIDLFHASAAIAPPRPTTGKKSSHPKTSKETSANAKKTQAVERAKNAPLTSSAKASSPELEAVCVDFDDVETLPVIDRRSGDAG